MDKAGANSGMRESTGRQPPEQPQSGGPSTSSGDKGPKQSVPAQQAQRAAPQQVQRAALQQVQRASPPPAQSNAALSQSFDSRSMAMAQKNQQPPQNKPQGDISSPSALRTSVDAAISNVDRALSDMHKQEVERLKARLDVRFFVQWLLFCKYVTFTTDWVVVYDCMAAGDGTRTRRCR